MIYALFGFSWMWLDCDLVELKTNGLTTLITELAGLACEVKERRASR